MILTMEKDLETAGNAADMFVTVREVAALSGTTIAAVNRCVDRRVVIEVKGGRRERRLTPQAAYFMALKPELDRVGMSLASSARLYRAIAAVPEDELTIREIALSEAVRIHTSGLADVVARTREYLAARNRYIASDPAIKGGVPTIRGTRIDVYSVAQRLDAGEAIEHLVEDYPEVPAQAFEAAALFARTHPRRGRPPRIARSAAA
jgi:uncharacterized protein (DUF433 family)